MSRHEEKLRFTKEPFIEDVGPRKIRSIRFSTFSGDEIRNSAEVQVWNNRFYDANVKPVEHGLLDLRMQDGFCATCHGSFSDCPGHFGFLKLTLPVFNIGYFSSILNILKCICKSCARILLPEKERKEFLKKMRNPRADVTQKNAYVKAIRDKCKASRCVRCGYINGVVKKGQSSLGIVQDFTKVHDETLQEFHSALSHIKDKERFRKTHVLSPDKALALFKKMVDEDCEVLYLKDRPEKLIVTDIAVPPVAVRPSVFMDLNNEDSITNMLRNIINTNSILREDLEGSAPAFKCLDCWAVLQAQVAEYINSEAPRLKGKQGRFRGNLSGKRVEFTGRTVISPDPNLKITEVAIPILMARVLTYPERVSQHNIEKLRQCVRNGPTKYPGANFVTHPDGTRLHLKYVEKKNVANELKYGYVVERHLEDGDVVLLTGNQAKIMPWRTLRFNESVCNPYNADFDGDEMNLHVPQTEEARTEALTLMGVQNNLCTPKNGEILVASTQDFLTSSFLITRKDTFYDRASFSLMCSYMSDGMDSIDLPTPALLKPIELWTGKQLFSVLVRPNAKTRVFLNLTLRERIYSKSGKRCNGNKDGLFSVLIRDYNSHAAAACMNRLAKLSARWIGNHGFSIGIDDVQPGESLIQKKKKTIDKGYELCDEFICLYNKGKLPLQSGCNAAETLEAEISKELNDIREATGKVCMEELHWRNSPLIMSQCGSKGSSINISQMIACVGQQSVGGRRAPNGFIDRSLPHFHRNSKTPSAKGFVANSFYTGLTATEFFFHTMGGREGLVDTAVKTAETGYMSRRLMKALEDLSSHYDQTVRNASGGIVQFIYGDDAMDPARMEGEDGKPLNLHQLFSKIMATCPSGSHTTLSPSEIGQIVDERLSHPDMCVEGASSDAFKKSLKDFNKEILQLDEDLVGDGDSDVLESVAAKISGISCRQLKVTLLAFFVLSILGFLGNLHISLPFKEGRTWSSCWCHWSQSIGEPGTQMTLKTFHFAGVASMNVTLGVPRIKEIINAAKNIKTPIITAALVCDDDEKSAQIVKGRIEKTLLGEVAKAVKIVLKSSQPYIVVVLDMERIEALHMRISSYSVQQSIVDHPKLKLKHEVSIALASALVSIPFDSQIYPPLTDRNNVQFELHSGIPTVQRAIINKENRIDRYKLLVEGSYNLLAVMGTPGVDGGKTTSNHVIEVFHTLGIEAARKCIIDEINYTMKSHSMKIDIRHMMLLADVMTFKILGITRFGITKMKDSVLMLASFEKTADHLFNASVNGREDQIEGVSECIIMGIPMPLGTGILKVRQRVDHLPELKYEPDPIFSSYK
ncbi:unnamed protein product [Spirodela intermedia]|uniref:DNA-directed RNA polymerase subunit n=1 Tax=Spirodela intermedia TaxID=51605 RepID=A0A7I8IBV8_SPIIN|nr:unnamed protein product [Spirodela intermedia]CAA6654834.1 unnamed protein product [Spirodela intermedia]